MLKGKKGIYLLIPLNVFIWGFFIYRFYTAYHESDQEIATEPKMENIGSPVRDSAEYKLSLAYDDPFLKKGSASEAYTFKGNEISKKQEDKNIVKPKIKQETVKLMPDIKYLGLVKNSTSGSVTAIVTINGSSKLIKQDEMIE